MTGYGGNEACSLPLDSFKIENAKTYKVKVKISLSQAMEAHRFARG
jgi:hypothetical protein